MKQIKTKTSATKQAKIHAALSFKEEEHKELYYLETRESFGEAYPSTWQDETKPGRPRRPQSFKA